MRRTLAPSTLTLAGLVKHMALVEDDHFIAQFEATMPEPWATSTSTPSPTGSGRTAADDSPEELPALWEAAVVRSRAAVAAPAPRAARPRREVTEWTEAPNLRRVVVDMIEEYARHTGHADLIRESIDGLVGEGAPQ